MTPERGELTGWGEIAEYLGVSIRTAQIYEREQRLPIHRLPGAKGRVWALITEVDTWKENNPPDQQAGEGPTDDRKQPPGLSSRKSAGAAVFSPPRYPAAAGAAKSRGLRLASWASAAAVTIILVIAAATWHRAQPNDFKIQGSSLVVVDVKGYELWRYFFPWPIYGDAYSAHDERLKRGWLGDLKGDGEQQLVFEAIPINRMGEGTPVLCFRGDGKVGWQFMPGRTVTTGDGETMLPPYWANSVEVVQGKRPIDTRVVVSSNHYMGGANQVAFLDVNGKLVGEYWHPGHLLHLAQVDLDGNGKKELLLGGVNNGNHQATLVVLDPVNMSASVTPKDMRDHRFEVLGMTAAGERAVVLFPRSCLSIGQPFTRVRSVNVSRQRIIVAVSEGIEEDSSREFVYEFDYSLNIVNVEPGNGVSVTNAHQRLEHEGKLDHPFDFEKECALLKAGVIVRRKD